ncbi:hypothetical protein KJ059_08290 [Myxococcota bacterium]|nr:hypothetical protein [Myxococcota bacterium]MCZ7619922.1 hypothetical protein [Myxococcota bacterium]
MTRFGSFVPILALAALPLTGCWDFNNPSANEWDVQIIGDSVFDLSGDIHDVLQNLSGKSYKDRSVSGAKISAIDSQLGKALSRSSLNTIIADGGANDILQGSMDCDSDPLTQGCLDVLDYIADTMWNMVVDMYYGPSDDLAWLGYYHVKGSEAEKNEAIDYVYDNLYPDLFDLTPYGGSSVTGTVSGYGEYSGSYLGGFGTFVLDPRNYIFSSDIKSDDIHPTASGSQKLANLIWGVMVQQGMYR